MTIASTVERCVFTAGGGGGGQADDDDEVVFRPFAGVLSNKSGATVVI